jgi:hypothetical protein
LCTHSPKNKNKNKNRVKLFKKIPTNHNFYGPCVKELHTLLRKKLLKKFEENYDK